MKIVSWNCRHGFYNLGKYKKIRELDADIYVILEFNTVADTDDEYEEFIKNKKVLMYYDEDIGGRNKGIAIIAKEDIELKDNNWYYDYNDFLSVRVKDSFDLVVVWTHEYVKEDGKWVKKGNNEYIRRIEEYLRRYKDELINSDNLVMCGDFNIDLASNKEDKDYFIKLLEEYGYESIYHKEFDEGFGEESTKTFFNKDGAFYIDYLFSNTEFISCFDVGEKDDYVENDYIKLLIQNCNDVDLVVCNCYMLTNNKKINSNHIFGNSFFEGNETIFNNIIIPMITLDNNKTNMLYPAWNKLYRKQVINDNNLKFDTNLPYAEDYMFCIQFFKLISCVRFIDYPLYVYDCTIQDSLSKVPITIEKLDKYNYVHARVAELFPEKGREVFPTLVLYDCKHHIRLYARLNGIKGFKTFCNDVYNMDAFKKAAINKPQNVSWWHLGLPSSLRSKNHHSLFLCWAYLFSCNGFIKYYIKKFF